MVPQSLSFSRNHAGKPALVWDAEGGSVDERGVHLQFNLSHTGSLLGAPNFHHERRLLHCRASKKLGYNMRPARTNMPETAYKRGLTGQGMREANLQTFQYIARHSAAHSTRVVLQ